MERFDTHVGSVKPAFQEAPKILQRVGVNDAIYVGNRMVDDLVRVLTFKTIVRFQVVTIERRASLDMFSHFILESFLFAVIDYGSPNLSAALQDSHDRNLPFRSASGDAALPLRDMHVPRFAPDEGLVYLDFARKLFQERAGLHSLPNPVHHKPC